MNEKRSERIQSIVRAFVILETIASSAGSMGLSDIARETGYSQPSVHRALRTLADLGYVRQDQSRTYGLGPKLIRLGDRAVREISAWARPVLHSVVRELGESANLAIREGDRVMYIAHVASPQSVRMFTDVGSSAYLHTTGVGKALLAQMSGEEVADIVSRTGMPSETAHTITSQEDLLRQLAEVRVEGYAIDREEQEIGVCCIAVPVRHSPTHLALSVSGPSSRMNDEMVASAVPILKEASETLSTYLTQ